MTQSWIILVVAGLFEVYWAVGLKAGLSLEKPVHSVAVLAAMVISMAMLGYSLKSLPVGTAYAVWTGIGAVGTAMIGILRYSESPSPMRLGCIALIVIGIIGLRLTTSSAPEAPAN